ncbi:MAG: N-acetyl-gamma-glutamyl-phosphate reductase [Chloroflexota bacterium]
MTQIVERPSDTLSADGAKARVRVGIIGATGYVGGELLRLLHRHPRVEVVGLFGRNRDNEPVGASHPHLDGTGHVIHGELPDAEVVFLALPHGTTAALVPDLVAAGRTVIDLGSDFRLKDPADYPRWYKLDHPAPELLKVAVYGMPELHRAELAALRDQPVRIVGAPGCYPTATILALGPLARKGLIADVVVDAKSGVSGAGKDPKPDLTFSEVNESVKAYGIGGHRHVAEMEQELGLLAPDAAKAGVQGIDFLPHLIPMTRGILSAGHVRPTRPIDQAELDEIYAEAYADEPFVQVSRTPVATGHVLGSNYVRVHVTADPRTGRVLAVGAIDNLVKGAAGQGIQAFNVVMGFPETTGLEQLPLAP